MKTLIAITSENSKKVLENAIRKVNELHQWNISVDYYDIGNKEEIAAINTKTREQILNLGIYMGELGF